MSKAVLISIQPKWCELIASGKKTIEVRKTRPKIETPFKCYIYCTKDRLALLRDDEDTEERYKYDIWEHAEFHQSCGKEILGSKVIGEFVCDDKFTVAANAYGHEYIERVSCLSHKELENYQGEKTYIWDWHISNLVIYDKPKELGEFYNLCDESLTDRETAKCKQCMYHRSKKEMSLANEQNCVCNGAKPLIRPPQSWCYVEEIK